MEDYSNFLSGLRGIFIFYFCASCAPCWVIMGLNERGYLGAWICRKNVWASLWLLEINKNKWGICNIKDCLLVFHFVCFDMNISRCWMSPWVINRIKMTAEYVCMGFSSRTNIIGFISDRLFLRLINKIKCTKCLQIRFMTEENRKLWLCQVESS